MFKVLISDAMNNVAQKIFEKQKISVDVKTGLSEEEIVKIIPEYDGMVVRSATKVTKNIILAAKKLKVIARAGAGVDNIDVATAKEKNMLVMNTPGGNTNATAEHAFALIMSALRKIPYANDTTHKGKWEKKNIKDPEDFNFLSDWSTHYQSWKNINFCPIKIIKYEDCLIDAQKIFISTLDFLSKFLKFKFDEKKLNKSLNSTSFKNLSQMDLLYPSTFLDSPNNHLSHRDI